MICDKHIMCVCDVYLFLLWSFIVGEGEGGIRDCVRAQFCPFSQTTSSPLNYCYSWKSN